MNEEIQLTVVMLILSAALALSVIGFFIVSPVLGIFVIVFALRGSRAARAPEREAPVTLAPLVDIEVRGVEGKRRPVDPTCCVPGCISSPRKATTCGVARS